MVLVLFGQNTLASESVVTGPPSALVSIWSTYDQDTPPMLMCAVRYGWQVDVATDVCRSKLRIADKRRRRICKLPQLMSPRDMVQSGRPSLHMSNILLFHSVQGMSTVPVCPS